jgi:hypothetical protein
MSSATPQEISVLRKLQGRNLAHLGCLIGLIVGLGGGLVLATILLLVVGLDGTVAAFIWLGISFVLGAAGWITGSTLSGRYDRADTLS